MCSPKVKLRYGQSVVRMKLIAISKLFGSTPFPSRRARRQIDGANMPQACSAEKSTEELSCIFCLVGLKGGALVSTLYAYSQHGDPDVKSLVKHLLNQVDYSRILYHMMSLCAYQPRHISDQKWQIFFFLILRG